MLWFAGWCRLVFLHLALRAGHGLFLKYIIAQPPAASRSNATPSQPNPTFSCEQASISNPIRAELPLSKHSLPILLLPAVLNFGPWSSS